MIIIARRLYDPAAIMNVLGCLIQKPELLSEIDKYRLTKDDFDEKFTKAIFIAIDNLYKNGAERIGPADVDAYLQQNPGAHKNFKENQGYEYLDDAEQLAKVENFSYYYGRVKKFSALRDLEEKGYSIKKIYDESILTPDKIRKMTEDFDRMSIKDIFDIVLQDYAKLEADYVGKMSGSRGIISEGMRELKSQLEKTPEVGFPLQGEYLNTILRGARKTKYYLRSGSTGSGKSIPNSTIVPTFYNGEKRVDEIKIGEYLIDKNGLPTKVLGVFPQGEQEVYNIYFKDGRVAKSSKDHLWSYYYQSHGQRKIKTKTLEEIILESEKRGFQNKNGSYYYKVLNNKPIDFKEKQLFIDPYILGLFLGDGSFREKNLFFYSEDVELVKNIESITNWKAHQYNNDKFRYYFTKENKKITVEYFLQNNQHLIKTYSYNKFIPREYFESSIEQRFKLLQGLMDTDGSVDLKTRCSFSTTSYQLKEDVLKLARSLGFICNVSLDKRVEKYSKGICYHIIFSSQNENKINLFQLSRKKDRVINFIKKQKKEEKNDYNPIIKIEKTKDIEEMTCFLVDNEEHLFLMNDYIVTHNTRLMLGDACNIAFPYRYNKRSQKWVREGFKEKVLFITTEIDSEELQTMVWAYLADVNEEKILYNKYENDEEERVQKAIEVAEEYQDNFHWEHIPDPTIEGITAAVRNQVRNHGITHVFYDYIFSSPSLMREFDGQNLREDEPNRLNVLSHFFQ